MSDLDESEIDPPNSSELGVEDVAPSDATGDALDGDGEDEPPVGSGRDKPNGRGRSRRPRRSWKRTAIEWVSIVAVAALVAVGIRAFVFQAFYVPSPSMYPTLQDGDRILVQKLFFSPKDLHTGDIIVFKGPPAVATMCSSDETDLVKRVIGLPGETISSTGNTVYLNGKALAEPWLPRGTKLGAEIPTFKIPQGQYYVLGDNRSVSCDSRSWGTVPAQNIVGRVVLLWWRHNLPYFHLF